MKSLLIAVLILLQTTVYSQSQNLTLQQFFADANQFFTAYVNSEGKVNYELASKETALTKLISDISIMDLTNTSTTEQKAFYINAYNLMAINNVTEHYPISSVRKIRAFFKSPITVANIATNLDQLEKSMKPSNDPRLHMILVCAANSCPILRNAAYVPTDLDQQINNAVRVSLSKSHVVNPTNNGTVAGSKIFEWYKGDFDTSGGVISFINQYTDYNLAPSTNMSYMSYDWALNNEKFAVHFTPATSVNLEPTMSNANQNVAKKATIVKKNKKVITTNKTNTSINNTTVTTSTSTHTTTQTTNTSPSKNKRFIVSSLYKKGNFDIHFFNNSYVETVTKPNSEDFDNQSVFLTNYIQLTYGINKRFNVGLDIKMRSVTNTTSEDVSAFDALKYSNKGLLLGQADGYLGYQRAGLTAIGIKAKVLPFTSIPKMSIQSTLYIPLIGSESNDNGYIDWTAPTLTTQLFYDHDITSNVSLFTEFDVIVENINGATLKQSEGYYQVSTPMTMILSYFPTNKSTVYLLLNSTPNWGNAVNSDKELTSSYNPYSQYGAGFKYFITKSIQAEIIYTRFHSVNINKTANTFNFGIRYFGLR